VGSWEATNLFDRVTRHTKEPLWDQSGSAFTTEEKNREKQPMGICSGRDRFDPACPGSGAAAHRLRAGEGGDDTDTCVSETDGHACPEQSKP
jgi:hypothetical protein